LASGLCSRASPQRLGDDERDAIVVQRLIEAAVRKPGATVTEVVSEHIDLLTAVGSDTRSHYRQQLAAHIAPAGIATASYGDRVPVLTGLTAARVHRALPRAIGVAFVAVPVQRRPLQLVDRAGQIRFVTRAVADLDAVLVTTDLGQALATTPEQTVLDLGRADPRGEDPDAREAIDALWPECDQAVLAEIAGRQRMRATLTRLRAAR